MRTAVFTQIGLDSGALGLLGSVVHRFHGHGHYLGTAFVDDEPRGEFEIVVSKDAAPATQVDLSALTSPSSEYCCDARRPSYPVAPGGHIAFYVGSGNERWATQIGDPRAREAEFDSRELKGEDLFAASILRPGTYRVSNALGTGNTEITVRYPTPGKKPYRPEDPIRLKVNDPESRKPLRVGPAQGIIFEATESARIVVELTKPDDGPRTRG